MANERAYFSYLLRMWQSDSGGKIVWLASLESPLTGERHGFSDLEALFDFVRTRSLLTQRGESNLSSGELTEEENDQEQ